MTRLEEIRERWEKATPGPWDAVPGAFGDPANGPDHMRVVRAPHQNAHESIASLEYERQGGDDADAIAHAREDVPWLLAEVERLTKSVGAFSTARDRAKAAIQRVRDLHPKVEDPRHGCCAEPKLCDGHGPECRSPEHPLGGVPWPCATLRAIEEGNSNG